MTQVVAAVLTVVVAVVEDLGGTIGITGPTSVSASKLLSYCVISAAPARLASINEATFSFKFAIELIDYKQKKIKIKQEKARQDNNAP